MKKVLVALVAVAAVALIASPAFAQPGRGAGRDLVLLADAGIAKELKLDDSQTKKFKELQDNRPGFMDREKMREWNEDVQKAVDGLKADQKKRLDQLKFQQAGVGNFYSRGFGGGGRGRLNDRVLEQLGVNEDGKKKIQEVADAYNKAREELGRPDPEKIDEYRKKSAELQKTYLDKFVAALSSDAKKKYDDLFGPAYKGEFPRPMRPGPGA